MRVCVCACACVCVHKCALCCGCGGGVGDSLLIQINPTQYKIIAADEYSIKTHQTTTQRHHYASMSVKMPHPILQFF